MINLLLILGLLLLVTGIITLSWDSSFILLLAILVIILILRNIFQDERLNKLEKQLNDLLKLQSKEQPNKTTTIPAQTTESVAKPLAPSKQVATGMQPSVATQVLPVKNAAKTTAATPTTPVATTTPPISKEPSFDLIAMAKSWLMTGNPIAKIGILILFFGVAFLLKYVAQHVYISIALRLSGVFLLGIIMVFIGWRLPGNRKDFASILQGGGVGIMYLAVYAAFAIYEILPYPIAFALLTVIVIATGLISILRDAKAIAVTAILGGFLAPILITTGPYHHIVLFSYYLILNIAILSVSWFKSWRDLNLMGFIFTFVLSALWGWQSYQPAYWFSTEIFLIAFFIFYVGLAILFTLHQEPSSKNIIDSIITFGTPTIVLALQADLMKGVEHGLAWSTFLCMLFYAVLALLLYVANRETFRGLTAAFAGIAVMFGTITIPLTFSGIWISSDWALESIIMLWYGVRQQQLFPRLAAGIILITSTILFIFDNQAANITQPFFNEYYLSGLFIVFANLICSYLYYSIRDQQHESEFSYAIVFFLLGLFGWYYLNIEHIYDYVDAKHQFITILIFSTSSSLIAWILNEALDWHWLRYPALALLPIMALMSIPVYPYDYYHPNGSIPTWIVCFIILFSILYRHEKYHKDYLSGLHLCTFLFLTWFIADRIDVTLRQYADLPFTWSFIVWAVVPTLMLFITAYGRKHIAWPIKQYESSYWYAGGSIFVIFLMLWFLFSNLLPGNVSPLIYIPLLNPLDMAIAFALLATILWIRSANEWLYHTIENVSLKEFLEIISVAVFIWLTAMLLRSLHQWLSIPYDWDSLWGSITVQGCLSIFWTILALIETYIAARINQRVLWFLGFALIWVVIFKLFLIDLSGTNTIERIVAFIGVGLIMLVNGYISPLPPKEK